MKTCPNCYTLNSESNQFCSKCGESIASINAKPTPTSSNSIMDRLTQCLQCGWENNDSSLDVCEKCGASILVSRSPTVEPYSYPQDGKEGVLALVFGILSLFCCAPIFGPLALIQANLSHNDSLGKVGKILGIIGISLFGLGFLVWILKQFGWFL